MKEETEKNKKNIFYKNNSRSGISLIVLVITIIIVIILAAAVIISLQNNNPMIEANRARINSDVANMQAIFTNTVGKIMAENQDVVTIDKAQLNTVTNGDRKATGIATYKIKGTDGSIVVEGKIKFEAGKNEGTTYYTGKELPLYSNETKWYVDEQGLISVNIGGTKYGEGEQNGEVTPSKPEEPGEIDGEEIASSENPVIKSGHLRDMISWYGSWITKVKFETNVRVPSNKIESWDISEAEDGSVMAWIEDDGNEEEDGYILTIAGKEKIIANNNSEGLFYNLYEVKEIENLEKLDTSNVTNMSKMFESCRSLTKINLSKFNTSNVTNMSEMLKACELLTEVDLTVFDTSNVIDMKGMFFECASLVTVNLTGLNTNKVENMCGMFDSCENLENVNWNISTTSNLVDVSRMFYNCKKLKKFNLDGLDTSNLSYIYGMFSGCESLTTTLNIKNSIYSYDNIFENAAINSGAKITVNYTVETSSFADSLIATKSSSSNVVKGVQID